MIQADSVSSNISFSFLKFVFLFFFVLMKMKQMRMSAIIVYPMESLMRQHRLSLPRSPACLSLFPSMSPQWTFIGCLVDGCLLTSSDIFQVIFLSMLLTVSRNFYLFISVCSDPDWSEGDVEMIFAIVEGPFGMSYGDFAWVYPVFWQMNDWVASYVDMAWIGRSLDLTSISCWLSNLVAAFSSWIFLL